MSIGDLFRLHRRVPPEEARSVRKKLERTIAKHDIAANEFHEAISDLLQRMDQRIKEDGERRQHVKNGKGSNSQS